MPRKDRSFFLGITCLALLLNTLPFLLAMQAGGAELIFDGILLNPLDGHTYLAKMFQGFRGDWRFTLPYSVNPGAGAYINLYYLFLGHVARLTHLSLPFIYSLFRLLGGLLLLLSLARFFEVTIAETRPRRVAFALAALGSGLGWMLIPTGAFTADFWVAETYPFLSTYNNPHFPLGLALLLWLLTFPPPTADVPPIRAGWPFALVALALGVISPFGVIIAVIVLTGWLIVPSLHALRQRTWWTIFQPPQFSRLLWTCLGGLPMLAYQFWVVRTDPIFAGWDAQNLTLTPPWWDVLVALSPALLLALFGWRKLKTDTPAYLLAVWAVFGLLLILFPFGLQRRFMMGLYIPFAGLAALGIETITRGKRSQTQMWIVTLFLLALPTNLIVLLAGQSGAQTHDPLLYHTRDESRAFQWLTAETPPHAIILSAPDTGLIIPAFSGRQVLYGHPFETVNAEAEKQAVLAFFEMTETEAQAFLLERGIDFVFFGPRERKLGALPILQNLELVFESGAVQIYAVEK